MGQEGKAELAAELLAVGAVSWPGGGCDWQPTNTRAAQDFHMGVRKRIELINQGLCIVGWL